MIDERTVAERATLAGEAGEAAVRWYDLPVTAVCMRLETSPEGLSEAEAARRLAIHGPNEVEVERETPWWVILLRQFTDPLIYILMAAAAVTFLLDHLSDTAVIVVVVLLNAIVGYVQERKAQREMRALARMNAPVAEVVRGGEVREIASRELVPGDVVVLSSGVRVPADLRISVARELEADESALTGESLPTSKRVEAVQGERLVAGDQVDLAFAGTVITRGRGRGIVVRTGARTELGRIATAVSEIGQQTAPLQETMQRFGRRIGLALAVLGAVMVPLGLAQGMPLEEIFLAAVALAVSAVPEGLPVVMTVTLAIGVSRMAGRRAIVRALPAVETLGSTTVIGSDKTGTLTKNEMTVRAIWTGGREYEVTGAGYDSRGEILRDEYSVMASGDEPLRLTLLAGTLANEADAGAAERGEARGDPTETALHVVAVKAGLHPSRARAQHPERDILPFESEARLMATLNDGPRGATLFVKGAPEAIIERCASMVGPTGEVPLDAAAARGAAASMAERGLRVLAMAYRPVNGDSIDRAHLEGELILAGLQGMEDPVRPEAIDAVAASHEAGIRVLMLTGDHADTAVVIGRQLGLDRAVEGALEGSALAELDDAALDERLERVDIYARVAPEHKLRIVRRLRERGEVVAVTGDGVNDAPALREAHLGIAMGRSGTDVAKEASDMVLADDNFASITAAVEEGRIIFANIRKVTFFLLCTAVGEVMVILAAMIAGWPLPFIAAQILWINLVTNGLQDVALAFEPGEPGLLRRPPRPRTEGVLTLRLLERLGAVGAVLATGTLAMFWWTYRDTGDLDLARSVAVTQMVVFQIFHVFNCRSLDRSIFRIPPFSNKFLFLSIVAALGAHLAALHVPWLQAIFRTVPLEPGQWGVIVLVASTVIIGGELDKWWARRRHRPFS